MGVASHTSIIGCGQIMGVAIKGGKPCISIIIIIYALSASSEISLDEIMENFENIFNGE